MKSGALLALVLSVAGECAPAGAGTNTTPADDGTLVAPPGFVVTTYAHVPDARFMVVGPDGSIYVSQPRLGQITRLVGGGHPAADSTQIVVTGLDGPHGMAFHHGAFYIANHAGVVRLTLNPAGVPAGAPAAVNHYTGDGGHSTRTIVFGADNGMYVSIGSSCNLCIEADSDRATVMRYDEDGSHGRVFARGLRNAVGLAVNPTTHAIWATQNERDNIAPNHEDLPPDELNILADGGDYGWPFCYGDRIPNPEYRDSTARCNRTIPPALGFQAHSAVLGITFLDRATRFPKDYRGDVLVAMHGSWNRTIPTGAKIVRVRVVDGQPTAYEDFVTGWQRHDGSRWGRPVDVVVTNDGAVLVSDDQAGAIYRVTGG
jgi:glucose/arabinose dehydrogenase